MNELGSMVCSICSCNYVTVLKYPLQNGISKYITRPNKMIDTSLMSDINTCESIKIDMSLKNAIALLWFRFGWVDIVEFFLTLSHFISPQFVFLILIAGRICAIVMMPTSYHHLSRQFAFWNVDLSDWVTDSFEFDRFIPQTKIIQMIFNGIVSKNRKSPMKINWMSILSMISYINWPIYSRTFL